MELIAALAQELEQPQSLVQNVVDLLDEGNTIPFIARYRKEQHGGMDDDILRRLEERLTYLRNLEERKGEVLNSIQQQDKLTEELQAQIEAAQTLAEVEDLYRPYKQKRRTRASIAKEKGLESLALQIWEQDGSLPPLDTLAEGYLSEEHEVNTIEEALQGASDIIAEMISDDADTRKVLRAAIHRKGAIETKGATDEDSVYRLYYEFARPVSKMQGHQVLAINRGEKEGFLKVSMELDKDEALALVESRVLKSRGTEASRFLQTVVADAYTRLLEPSLEREIRSVLTEAAQEGAIHMFALNLKPLLLQPPVRGKVTMGLDPGYRNGCKVAVVDGIGKVLDTAVVYPTFGEKQQQEAIVKLSALAEKHKVDHIAIGNGTASRETEQMTVELLRQCKQPMVYMVVNEAGASVYSASKLAALEFPELDVNLRSAVSIARRLQDPLAELVKIEPKAIGVGQYQHDMPPVQLDTALGGVIEDCVNGVGVDVNTASPSLLKYVAGLSTVTSQNIVKYREENGAFKSRKQILKVPQIGPKAYEQCAGFLRVPESTAILDHTGVHPESYDATRSLLVLCGYKLEDVEKGNLAGLAQKIQELGEDKVAANCGIGRLTLQDIVKELQKPGRDPRDELPPPMFRTDILSMEDLTQGMELKGTVRNVIDFGAFVDIGVHQDGLVHVSELSEQFVRHPSQVVAVGDTVNIVVLSVDAPKKRIALSIKQAKGKS